VAVALLSMALMKSDLHHRNTSVIDPLTSMLNRNALQARTAELAQLAPLTHKSVGVIVGDLDRFKLINDEYGHARGDAVLREVAYEMRKSLRSFELFYRLGGEEFLFLLPGIDLVEGVEIAQHLRDAVQASQAGGLPVTGSFGVSVATGEGIEFLTLYRAADEAMYQAKADGRNRVVAFQHAPALAA
jgi:diguanylate cyclase (GGDEF)-like protein